MLRRIAPRLLGHIAPRRHRAVSVSCPRSCRTLPHGRRRAVSRAALLHRATLAWPYRAAPYRAVSVSCRRSCRTLPCPALPRPPCVTLLRVTRAPTLCFAVPRRVPASRLQPASVRCARRASRTFRCPPCPAVSRREPRRRISRRPTALPLLACRSLPALPRRQPGTWPRFPTTHAVPAPLRPDPSSCGRLVRPNRLHLSGVRQSSSSRPRSSTRTRRDLPSQLISLSSRTRSAPHRNSTPRPQRHRPSPSSPPSYAQ